MSVPIPFRARLVADRTLAPGVRELKFERVDGEQLVYEAGQWVNLLMPMNGAVEKRSYSIASPPLDGSTFEVAVTKVEGGPGSSFLHALGIGSELDVHGPSGFFVRRNDEPALFVGTGTGLTPLRSMLYDALVRKDESTPLHLLAGFRYEHDRLYQEELATLADRHSNFNAECTLSRPTDTWQGQAGYVQLHVPRIYEALTARAAGRPVHVYICGLQKMVAEVRDLLRKKMNLPRELVHSERYD